MPDPDVVPNGDLVRPAPIEEVGVVDVGEPVGDFPLGHMMLGHTMHRVVTWVYSHVRGDRAEFADV